jgi:hypothetical protein
MQTPLRCLVQFVLMFVCLMALIVLGGQSSPAADPAIQPAKKKILFIAGVPSHPYAQHEFNAGCTLLAKCLNDSGLPVEAVVNKDGWPTDVKTFDGVSAVVMYCDGGDGHMVMKHLDQLDDLAKKGIGIGAIHYGVEVPKGAAGNYFIDWMGGFFETDWSVNPTWTADFKSLPDHPVTRGVKPFAIKDEWYFHMRFPDGMTRVTSILAAVPPASTMLRKKGSDGQMHETDGPHEGNPTVRDEVAKGLPQTMCWVTERPDGGRGFGLTGGHYHWNWGNDNFRKLALNLIAWIAKLEIPADGVPSTTPTVDELMSGMDPKKPLPEFNSEAFQKMLDEWKQND